MDRSIKILIVARIVILSFLMVVICLFNIPSLFIEEPALYQLYFDFLSFVNNSLFLIIGIGLISLISGIFWHIKFPYKNFAPFISSVLAIFAVELLYNFYLFLDKTFIHSGLELVLIDYYIYIFFLALILGYIQIVRIFIKIRKIRISKRKLRKSMKESSRQFQPPEQKTPPKQRISEEQSQGKTAKELPEKQQPQEQQIPPEQTPEKKYEEAQKRELEKQKIEKKGIGDKFNEAIYLFVEKLAGGAISLVDSFKSSERT